MVKLYEGGAYLLHGTEVIADAPDALAAVKSKTGIETTKEAAAKETMAYGILSAHNTSGNMQQLQIKADFARHYLCRNHPDCKSIRTGKIPDPLCSDQLP